jgi:hypothetical protein
MEKLVIKKDWDELSLNEKIDYRTENLRANCNRNIKITKDQLLLMGQSRFSLFINKHPVIASTSNDWMFCDDKEFIADVLENDEDFILFERDRGNGEYWIEVGYSLFEVMEFDESDPLWRESYFWMGYSPSTELWCFVPSLEAAHSLIEKRRKEENIKELILRQISS